MVSVLRMRDDEGRTKSLFVLGRREGNRGQVRAKCYRKNALRTKADERLGARRI